jgi:hypothetical protein
MNLISREELKKKIDNNEEFKLVMTLSDFAFNAKHTKLNVVIFYELGERNFLFY